MVERRIIRTPRPVSNERQKILHVTLLPWDPYSCNLYCLFIQLFRSVPWAPGGFLSTKMELVCWHKDQVQETLMMMKGGIQVSHSLKCSPGKEKPTSADVLGEKLPWLWKRKHDIWPSLLLERNLNEKVGDLTKVKLFFIFLAPLCLGEKRNQLALPLKTPQKGQQWAVGASVAFTLQMMIWLTTLITSSDISICGDSRGG